MAGARRWGGNKATDQNLSLGDLVLAKVKGFPAWPAKISRPEDWDRIPEPEKHFVQFFGTQEIAFVAPADIQVFTSETKNKFSACYQAKTKYFSQAVKEICRAFEELQNQNSCCLRDDTDRDGSSVNGAQGNGVRVSLKDGSCVAPGKGETGGYGKDRPLSKMVRCSQGDEMTDDNVKPTFLLSLADGILSQTMSSDREQKMSNGSKVKEAPFGDHQKSKKHGMGLVERQKISSSPSLRDESNTDSADRSNSLMKEKVGISGFSPQTVRSCLHKSSGKTEKDVFEAKNNLKTVDRRSLMVSNSTVGGNERKSDSEVENPRFTNDDSITAKRAKYVDVKPDASKAFLVKVSKNDCQGHENIDNVVKVEMSKRLDSPLLALKACTATGLDALIDKAAGPLLKWHKHASQGIYGPSQLDFDNRSRNLSPDPGNGNTGPNNDVVQRVQGPKRRRAVRLCDKAEEEDPRTPVHGGSSRSYRASSSVSNDCNKRVGANSSSKVNRSLGDAAGAENSELKESLSQLNSECKSHRTQTAEMKPSSNVYLTPENLQPKQVNSKEEKTVFCSPKKSTSACKAVDQHSITKVTLRVSNNKAQRKAQTRSAGNLDLVSDGLKFSQDQASGSRNKQDQPVDQTNLTPKASSMINDSAIVARALIEHDIPREGQSRFPFDSKTRGSVTSMKNLIAAAQAKRRQAHSHLPSSSSPSLVHRFSSGDTNMVWSDREEFSHQSMVISPPTLGGESRSRNQSDALEIEGKSGSDRRIDGGPLSCDTEAAVARDAFQGMIETLSRTKESIGRATRLAIDCAKYGIANEVVELLIEKLETETSSHRKVDLFFLVDSITQCSHNQKGVAGAFYIPTIQAALPRLLGAAAPAGTGARENHRQCLKVLRLWIERKIFPESFLRHYIDEFGGPNNDLVSGFFLRRPSIAERAVDDPIRDMEGMLLDEYGSNATFQLHGLLLSNAFNDDEEEEDDCPGGSFGGASDSSTMESVPAVGKLETVTAAKSERRHCGLEDMELETEDLSAHQNFERLSVDCGAVDMDYEHQGSNSMLEPVLNSSNEFPPTPQGSPPLPPDSPPPTPPLPPSLPPLPPPLSPSPPPPPPPLLSQLPSPHSFFPPLLMLSQLTMIPHQFLPQPPIRASPQLAYQSHGSQQSVCFTPVGACDTQEASGHSSSLLSNCRHTDMLLNQQSSQPIQKLQVGNSTFSEGQLLQSFPQPLSSHFSFTRPVVPQHLQHSYPSYVFPSQHDVQRQFVIDEQWQPTSDEYSVGNQQGGLVAGRNQLHSATFRKEGFIRPTIDMLLVSNMSLPDSATNNLPAGAPKPS